MAVNKKGSRKIVVENHEFRWRATGNDDWISIVVWPNDNENSRVVADARYHHDWKKTAEGHYISNSQAIITNRIIREVILHVGVRKIVDGTGQLHLGAIEKFYDFKKAIRS